MGAKLSVIWGMMHVLFRFVSLALTACALACGMGLLPALAEGKLRYVGQGLTLELITSHEVAKPGDKVTYGLVVQHEPGYHTYWMSPGIIGYPMTLEWQWAEEVETEVQYPYPEKTMMSVHPCYGYERDVTLLSHVTIPTDFQAQTLTGTLKLSWMCCAQDCCPDHHSIEVHLTVDKAESRESAQADLIRKAQCEIPQPHPQISARMCSEIDADPLLVELVMPTALEPLHLFSEDNQTSSGVVQEFAPQSEAEGMTTYLVSLRRYEFSPKEQQEAAFVVQTPQGHWRVVAAY